VSRPLICFWLGLRLSLSLFGILLLAGKQVGEVVSLNYYFFEIGGCLPDFVCIVYK
jgi:hypothetical protein